jgi:hypothetical protein
MFSWPGVCLMSDVNSVMKESCRCWRADHGGVVRNRDVTCGLWSVSRRNCLPSSKNLKCLTALKVASIKSHYAQGQIKHGCIGGFMYKSPQGILMG